MRKPSLFIIISACYFISQMLLPKTLYGQFLIGNVMNKNGNPIENSKIHLTFTFPGNIYGFFDEVKPYFPFTIFNLHNPIRNDGVFVLHIRDTTIISVALKDRYQKLKKMIFDGVIFTPSRDIYYDIDRKNDNGFLLRDDIYLTEYQEYVPKYSYHSPKYRKDVFLLSGLSENTIFNDNPPLEPWSVTDIRGEFKVPIRDLPIGMKFHPVDDRPGSIMDTVVVDNLIGIAAVKDSFYHYDSIRIGAGDNFINIVLDKISQKGKASPEESPQGFSLLQNYPNPFNSLTHISFDVPEPAQVDVIIYNVLGKRVRKLLSEKVSTGKHFVYWDGRDDSNLPVSSGVYIYEMRTRSIIQRKKMVLLK